MSTGILTATTADILTDIRTTHGAPTSAISGASEIVIVFIVSNSTDISTAFSLYTSKDASKHFYQFFILYCLWVSCHFNFVSHSLHDNSTDFISYGEDSLAANRPRNTAFSLVTLSVSTVASILIAALSSTVYVTLCQAKISNAMSHFRKCCLFYCSYILLQWCQLHKMPKTVFSLVFVFP